MTDETDQTSQAEVLRQIRDEVRAMRREMEEQREAVERPALGRSAAGENPQGLRNEYASLAEMIRGLRREQRGALQGLRHVS